MIHDKISEAVINMDTDVKIEERRNRTIALVIAAYDAGRTHDIIAKGELIAEIARGGMD